MTTSKPSNNGARAKILRALLKHGMLTTKEIGDDTGLTPRQVIDNANQARVAGLCKSGRDDVTRIMGYQITDAGRKWLETNSKSAPEPVIEPIATAEESLSVAPIEIAEPALKPETAIIIDAPEDAPEPPAEEDLEQQTEVEGDYLYAIDSTTDGNLKIVGADRKEAIDLALNHARKTNTARHVYQLTLIGHTRSVVTVQFVEP